jgi:hypothetical protein
VATPGWADAAAHAANPSSATPQAEVAAHPDDYQAWFRPGVALIEEEMS